MGHDQIASPESEQDDFYSNDDLYNINSWGADLSFRELITMYEENELIKPEIQRKYVWDKAEASRFIDSVLLGLPVPSIFLAKTRIEKYLIVDGFQRIMTVHDYVKSVFSKDGTTFLLSRTDKINERWRGKTFQQLDEQHQRKIRSSTIHAIIFEQVKPENEDTSLFQVFERINTGGRTLLPQEIRNCVYQGPINSLLFELNKNKAWRSLFGLPGEEERMRDLEMILRGIALTFSDLSAINTQRISLKKFLNDFMGHKANSAPERIEEFRTAFTGVQTAILMALDKRAYQNLDSKGGFIERFYPTVYDSLFNAFFTAHIRDHLPIPTDISDRHKALLRDLKFQECASSRTTDLSNILKRFSLANQILFQ